MYPVNLPGGHLSLSNKGRWERSSISAVVASFWFSQSSIGWSIDWVNHSRIQEIHQSLIGKFWQLVAQYGYFTNRVLMTHFER